MYCWLGQLAKSNTTAKVSLPRSLQCYLLVVFMHFVLFQH
jgi:hypothetical protein